MTVATLFKQRNKIYLKQLSRYMKYVLNDHFVLAVLLLLGAGGFGYSNYVQTLSPGAVLPRMVLLIIMAVAVSSGTITTLIQSADLAFLLPLEQEVKKIIGKSIWKSLLILTIPLTFVSAAAMPLLVATMQVGFNLWPLFLATTILLKYLDLRGRYSAFLESDHSKRIKKTSVGKVVSVAGFSISIFYSLVVGVIFTVIAVAAASLYLKKTQNRNRRLQWEYIVEKEETRLQNLYRFINLFTEVSFIESHPNRMKWLDNWIRIQSGKKKDTHYFYIVRSFYRNPSYSGLVLRLLLIGSMLVLFSSGIVLKVLLSILFLYLIGFQLIPIYRQFQQNFYFQLYPVDETGKINSIQRLIAEILSLVTLIFTVSNLTQEVYSSGAVLVSGMIFTYLFTRLYLPRRLEKLN